MKADTKETYQERILRVLVHIQGRLDDALSLDDLAREACFSPYHFHRVFRGMVGETVMEHVRRLRLERAAMRLKHSSQPVTQIAFEAGYETHEAFTRAFRSRFAMSPTEFRKLHQTIKYPPAPSGVHYDPEGHVFTFTPNRTGGAPMQVEIRPLPTMRVAFIRHVGPYQEIGPTWQKLMGWAFQRGLVGPKTEFVSVYYDDPEVTAPEKTRGDACITVPPDVEPAGEVGVQEIGGGDYAVAIHKGPYEKLGETYARLCGEWLAESGREFRSAPALEFYRNNPQDTPPADLITEVCLPLEKK